LFLLLLLLLLLCSGSRAGRNLLQLYTSKWEEMSKILWSSPSSSSGNNCNLRINVVHLGVQGANDCGIWTWLLPKIYIDPEFQTLCDVTHTKKKKTGNLIT
jgi:hypothetical protein